MDEKIKLVDTLKSSQKILVISGASGSGKTTTCFLLQRLFPNRYVHILFDRSRPSRLGEFGSRHVDLQQMYRNHAIGVYTNIAEVTHGGMVAVRKADLLHAFAMGKIAVMEFPIERTSDLHKWFPNAEISAIELVAPSEAERLRRLLKDHKLTDERVEGLAYGRGRLEAYGTNKMFEIRKCDLVLITERENLLNTVLKIYRYMAIKSMTFDKLKKFQKMGLEYVRALLRQCDIVWKRYTLDECIDDYYVDLFRLKIVQ